MKQFSKVPLVCLALGCLAIWVLSWWLLIRFLPNYETRAQFGDMFGAINSFFSGIALVGVIYTVYLQQKEIQSQREEEQKNEQARTIQMQNFAEQLRLLQEQNQMEKEKTRRESTPVFQWRGGGGNKFMRQWDFVNLGGVFQINRVNVPEQVLPKFPPNYIGVGQRGNIVFSKTGGLPEEFNFEIEYTTVTQLRDKQRFRVQGESPPVPA